MKWSSSSPSNSAGGTETKYKPLPGGSRSEKDQALHRSSSKWSWSIGIPAAICVILISATALTFGSGILTTQNSQRTCTCGSDPTEAVARGCVFDPFGLVWLPDHCRDDDLIERFSRWGPEQNHHWDFADMVTGEPLSIERVSMRAKPFGSGRPNDVRTTLEWHHTHCLYILYKHQRQHETGVTMEERYRGQAHIDHCFKSIAEQLARHAGLEAMRGESEVDMYDS